MFFFTYRYFGASNIIFLTSNIILLASTSYSTLLHHTPRFYIILLAPSTQHPSSSLQRHLPHNYPQPTCTEWRHSPRDGGRSGEVSRSELPRKQCYGASSARVPAKTGQKRKKVSRWLGAYTTITPRFFAGCEITCDGDEGRRRVRPRLAERAGTRPKRGRSEQRVTRSVEATQRESSV